MKKLEVVLIEDWRKAWTMYSVWFFGLLMAFPELYNAAIASGLITQDQVPPLFSKLVTTISFIGLCSRLVGQKKKSIEELSPEAQKNVALGIETLEEAMEEKTKPIAEVVISEEAPAKPGQ